MTIWLLALLLMASLAGIGYRQGAIRVGFSFFGILIGAALAVPLGKLIKPLFGVFGVKSPLLLYFLPPLVIFILFSIIFKVAGTAVHQKVDVYFKYRAGDLRLALWERLSRRLGLCVAMLNGAAYVILVTVVLYSVSYWTVQLASSDTDPRWMRVLNQLGRDIDGSGMAKVARAIDGRSTWYDAADFAGLVYHNPLAEARLARYPALLGLSERHDFKDLGSDQSFTELRLRQAPIMEVLDHPKMQNITANVDTLKTVWNTVVPDMKDLENYLRTGISQKYDQEKILGRWNFDLNQSVAALRRSKPNMTSLEMQKWKLWMRNNFSQTSFVAMTDHQALFKNLPQVRLPAQGAPTAATGGQNQTLQGQWKGGEGKYEVTLSGGTEQLVTIDGERLKTNYEGIELVLVREI